MNTFEKIQALKKYPTPGSWLKIKTIDMHTGGEPLRVIIEGLPDLKGNNVLEYRKFMKENYDFLRTALMFEPRGHADMYGCILLPPNDPSGDFGILFLHNEGYSTMCGHAVIAISKLAVEMLWIEGDKNEIPIKIDAPCGRIDSFVKMKNGKVDHVYFHCVPSFVTALNETTNVDGIGEVTYDLAYGGAFYAFVDADKLGIDLGPENVQEHIQKGMAIKHAVEKSSSNIKHPFEPEMSFLYGTIFISKNAMNGADNRNICVFAEGEVDRSPTGSGVSGRMAIHHARGEMKVGQKPMVIESILGTKFKGSIVEELTYGPHKAVIPKVEGNANVVGQNEWVIDPEDKLKSGFILR